MSETIKFQNLPHPFSFTKEQKEFIDSLYPYDKDTWKLDQIKKSNATPDLLEKKQKMIEIKKYILDELTKIQGDYCIFCGWHKDIVGKRVFEREHIAPKNTDAYPQFMFEPANLVLSCKDCNSKKSTIKTIEKDGVDAVYSNCKFTIVHPYFDDYKKHFGFYWNHGIALEGKTQKGLNHIKYFGLNLPKQVESRGKEFFFIKALVSDKYQKILDKIRKINYSR